jgi:hypothetical protein
MIPSPAPIQRMTVAELAMRLQLELEDALTRIAVLERQRKVLLDALDERWRAELPQLGIENLRGTL